MKYSIFVVLGTKVLLVLLTLLQCCDGIVLSERNNKRKSGYDEVMKQIDVKNNFNG